MLGKFTCARLTRQPLLSQQVCRQNSGMYAFRRHRERHIVNSFTFCAGGFSHGHNLAVNVVFHTHFR